MTVSNTVSMRVSSRALRLAALSLSLALCACGAPAPGDDATVASTEDGVHGANVNNPYRVYFGVAASAGVDANRQVVDFGFNAKAGAPVMINVHRDGRGPVTAKLYRRSGTGSTLRLVDQMVAAAKKDAVLTDVLSTGGAFVVEVSTGGAAANVWVQADCVASSNGACAVAGQPGVACDPQHACDEGLFCKSSSGCGVSGSCETRPVLCPLVCFPNCGCDGKQYCNECIAERAGTTIAYPGACK